MAESMKIFSESSIHIRHNERTLKKHDCIVTLHPEPKETDILNHFKSTEFSKDVYWFIKVFWQKLSNVRNQSCSFI